MATLQVEVVGYQDSNSTERAGLASELRAELEERGVGEVRHASAPAEAGAKGTAVEWAQLAVAVVGTLPPVLTALQGWLDRNRGTSVRVKIGEDELVLDSATSTEQRHLVEQWLSRHAGA